MDLSPWEQRCGDGVCRTVMGGNGGRGMEEIEEVELIEEVEEVEASPQ